LSKVQECFKNWEVETHDYPIPVRLASIDGVERHLRQFLHQIIHQGTETDRRLRGGGYPESVSKFEAGVQISRAELEIARLGQAHRSLLIDVEHDRDASKEVQGSIKNNASTDLGVDRVGKATTSDNARGFERYLRERAGEICEAARGLCSAIADQIDHLNASKPNDPGRLTQQNELIAFLKTIADGLESLADTLDRSIAAGTRASPEPILLGKAGDIARNLSDAVLDGLERNRDYIVDCAIKFSVFGCGFMFLGSSGKRVGDFRGS
jgi:hypothetical protein